MGLNILFYDTLPVINIGNSKRCNTIKELLYQSDFITLHVPLTNETKNMIDKTKISMMKPGAFLLNYSRGRVMVLEDVKEALEKKHLAGLAIDVYPLEPYKNTNNWQCILQNIPNVILTPHISGSTQEAQFNICKEVSNKIINYVKNGNTFSCITIPNINENIQSNIIRILNIHNNIPGVI